MISKLKYFLTLHQNSARYAVALWLATVLALLVTYLLQIEPAQWAAFSVWAFFMQDPRLNHSKIIWWSIGTLVGALMAVVLIAFFNQIPELFLLSLSLWLAGCAGWATLTTSYRARGAILAGYTCAIVSLAAVEQPDAIFKIVVARVLCIFIGMMSAVFFVFICLPKHRHWQHTVSHLEEHFKSTINEVRTALLFNERKANDFRWRSVVNRLSALEHSLDATTAETADSRRHAGQVRSLVVTLFSVLAKVQALEIHFAEPAAVVAASNLAPLTNELKAFLAEIQANIKCSGSPGDPLMLEKQFLALQGKIFAERETQDKTDIAKCCSNQFVLILFGETLDDLWFALQDWQGLSIKQPSVVRPAYFCNHRDYQSAFVYGIRIFAVMAAASLFWIITQWPSGPIFMIFIAVVCSMLSLFECAPALGVTFLVSAAFSIVLSYVTLFWLFQNGNGVCALTVSLGVFLLPAAYAYRHPRLFGSAAVSMVIFYFLTNPSNKLSFGSIEFLNNSVAVICGTVLAFLAFYAIPSLEPSEKKANLLKAIGADLSRMPAIRGKCFEQNWTSLMFDRLRIFHRLTGANAAVVTPEILRVENEILIGLQLGLEKNRLNHHLHSKSCPAEDKALIVSLLNSFHVISYLPERIIKLFYSAVDELETRLKAADTTASERFLLKETIRKITRLLESRAKVHKVYV